MRCIQTCSGLEIQMQAGVERRSIAHRMRLLPRRQRFACHKLHGNEHLGGVAVFADLVDVDDIGVRQAR